MWKKSLVNIFLGLLSGSLVGLSSHVIYGYDFLIFVYLFPLLYVFNQKNIIQALLASLSYSLAFNCWLFFWIPFSLTEMWKFPLLYSFGAFIPFALVSEFQIFLIAVLRIKIFEKFSFSLKTISLVSLCYAGIESGFEIIFPDNLGLTIQGYKYLRQALDISGTALLSSFIWFTNEALFKALKEKSYKSLIPVGGLIILFSLYGVFQLNQIEKSYTSSVKALVVQPNFHHNDRNASREGQRYLVEKILDRHYQMSQTGLQNYPDTEFIVWPETTFPFYFQNHSSLYQEEKEIELINFLREKPVSLFFGSFGKTDATPVVITNNLYSIDHSQYDHRITRFEKTVLFPFGEYIPGANTFPFLKKIFPKANTPVAAKEPNVAPVGKHNLNIGAAICYEVLFSDFFIKLAQKNTQVVINITNESYFGNFGEPQINLFQTAVRATETRLPIIRSANTGLSGFIDASGEILKSSSMDEEVILYQEVQIPDRSKLFLPYVQYGNWWGKLGLLATLLSLIILFLPRRVK